MGKTNPQRRGAGGASLPRPLPQQRNNRRLNSRRRSQSRSCWLAGLVLLATTALMLVALEYVYYVQLSSSRPPKDYTATRQAATVVSRRQDDPMASRQKEEEPSIRTVATDNMAEAEADPNVPHYHMIFSTGCSAFQDWQSYVFFHQALAVQQPGTITRIVSGCKDHEQEQLQALFDDAKGALMQTYGTPTTDMKIHFTPDYSKVPHGDGSPRRKPYKYFNKPFGTKHWLEHALGFPNNMTAMDRDSIVILMDPDQLLLRPFRNNDFNNTHWTFAGRQRRDTTKSQDMEVRTSVTHGHPMGQKYGFALQWKSKINMTAVAVPEEQPSPIDRMSTEDAQTGYIVSAFSCRAPSCLPCECISL